MVVAKDSGVDFERIPAGTWQAVCVADYDLGFQQTAQYGAKHKVLITFEITEVMQKGEHAGKRFQISKRYTNSLNEKSQLRKDLEAWRGKPFTADEVKGFDLDKLIGANCFLNIVHEQKGDRTYANIKAIMKVPNGTPMMKPETPFDPANPPDWVKKIQAQAVDPSAKNGHAEQEPPIGDDEIPF